METETRRLIPLMLIDDKSRYTTHENSNEERKAAANELGECLKSAMADCYANNTLTKEAYISNVQKYLGEAIHQFTFEPNMEVTLVDQYGRKWNEAGSNQSMKSPLTGDRTLYGIQMLFNSLGIGIMPFNEDRDPIPPEIIVDYYKQKTSGVENPIFNILSLGRGPLSYEGAKNYIESDPMYLFLSNKLFYPIPFIRTNSSQTGEGEEKTLNTTESSSDELITMSQMEAFDFKITSDELKELNEMLQDYGITDKKSIALFMATCGHESGKGKKRIEDGTEEYFIKHGYSSNTRGAGYIQVTGDDQLDFYEHIKKPAPENRAQDIADNYAWEAAVWEWAVQKKGDGVVMNGYVQNHGDGENIFLVTQYFINGYLEKEYYPHFNDDLSDIRKGTTEFDYDFSEEWTDYNGDTFIGVLKVNGRTYRLPNGYKDRLENYREAIKAFK